MDIQAVLQPIASSTPAMTVAAAKTAQQNLSQWFLGQILNATVTSHKSTGTVTLQIQNQLIEAKTNSGASINVGTQLKLVVAKQGDPVVLRVLQQDTLKIANEVKQQLLRESIPKQASMEKLTSVLSQISNNIKAAVKVLPAPIELQMNKLIEHLPSKTSLNNDVGLKAAIKDSGLFLESKLMNETSGKVNLDKLLQTAGLITKQTSTSPQSHATLAQASSHVQHPSLAKDLKSNLLQLSEVITKYKQSSESQSNNGSKQTQTTPVFEVTKNTTTNTRAENTTKAIDLALKMDTENIAKQIESSVARIEVNQSKAMVTHDSQNPIWSVEIPVKDKQDIDLLKLNIQPDKDSKTKSENEQLWTANLKIDFENIGSVLAKLSIIDKEVNATLWSEDKALNVLINDNISLLDKQIERCGLSTGKIICLDEAPVEEKTQDTTSKLISIKI